MRDWPNSNLPPPHLLEALRPRRFQRFAATRMTPKERAALILQLQAEFLGIPKGTGAPPPQLLDALRSCSPGRAEPVSRLVRPGATEQTSRQTGARRQPRQPSVEAGKSLFETLRADARAGRTRSLSARGAASVAMYLASVEKQERAQRMDRLVRPGAAQTGQGLALEEKRPLHRINPTHRTLSMRGVLRLAREIAREEEMGRTVVVKPGDGRVLVRRGRRVLALQIEELGPDDEVIPDSDPYFRKKGRPRAVVEAWRGQSPCPDMPPDPNPSGRAGPTLRQPRWRQRFDLASPAERERMWQAMLDAPMGPDDIVLDDADGVLL